MNKLEQISRTFIFLIISIPIFVNPFSNSPYELSKTFFSFITIAFISLTIIFIKKEIILPNKYIILFFISNLISTIFSKYQNDSFFGYYPRYTDGDLINVGIFLFCFSIINLIPKLNIPKLIFYSSIPILFFLIFEIFFNKDRLIGTTGQSNFLSMFLILSLIFCLTNQNIFKQKNFFSYLYITLSIFFILKAASLTSIFIFLIILPFFYKEISFLKKSSPRSFILGVFLVLSLGYIFKDSIISKKFMDIQNQFKDNRPTLISDSLLIRTYIWKTTLELISNDFKSLLIGHGSNNFIYYFEKNRNPELNKLSEKYFLFDKPHNYYLELLFNYGILGFILFGYILYSSLKIKNKNFIYILSISIFVITNWLDIYLKIILFLLITQSLENEKINPDKFRGAIFSLSIVLISISSIFIISDFYKYKNNLKASLKINPTSEYYLTLYSIETNNFNIFSEIKNPVNFLNLITKYNNENKQKLIEYNIQEFNENFVIKYYLEK